MQLTFYQIGSREIRTESSEVLGDNFENNSKSNTESEDDVEGNIFYSIIN